MDDVLLEIDGEVATILLNRPAKRNAVTYAMWERLPDLYAQVVEGGQVRVLIVRGAGERAFSGGADISEFERLRTTPEQNKVYNAAAARAQSLLAQLPVPTVALIHGACVGGGLGLALSCDLRFGDASARFAITPAKLGIVYPLEVTKRLVDVVGPAHAKQILYTGQQLSAARARDIGLINDVLDDVDAGCMDIARTIASRAPYSVRATKQFIDMIAAGTTGETDETLAVRAGAFDTEDYREGVRAFLEKRVAEFTGR